MCIRDRGWGRNVPDNRLRDELHRGTGDLQRHGGNVAVGGNSGDAELPEYAHKYRGLRGEPVLAGDRASVELGASGGDLQPGRQD